MHKTQRTFTKEFKQEAVHLVQSSKKSQAQIAGDLGIAESTALALVPAVFPFQQGEQAFAFQWASDPTRRGDSPLKAGK